MPRIDLVGEKFGRLIVTSFSGKDKLRHLFWRCLCNCGAEKIIAASSLRSGVTQSCGCLSREKVVNRSTKHGHNRRGAMTQEYCSWFGMKQRCLNARHKFYDNYGGRGITVCERWMEFENFLADMGLKPSPKHSIDRIDNDGDYEPGNCRWATRSEQNRNRR